MSIPLPPVPPRGFRPPKPFPLPNLKVRPDVPLFKPLGLDWTKAKLAMGLTAEAIRDLILYEISITIQARGKGLTPDAFNQFASRLLGGIEQKLNNGGDWTADGPNVLKAARQLAEIAVILADANATISQAEIHAAFYAVQIGSNVCGPSGSGSWCDFFI